MKKNAFSAILLLALVGLVAFFLWDKKTPTIDTSVAPEPPAVSSGTATSLDSNPSTSAAPGSPDNIASRAAERPPTAPLATNLPPLILAQNARRAVIQYAQVYGENPIGTNPEITAALMGNNPKHINFITPDAGLQVNADGEMVDAWGAPLFFHQLSGHEMEIRSAGEDHQMWTADDLIVHQ